MGLIRGSSAKPIAEVAKKNSKISLKMPKISYHLWAFLMAIQFYLTDVGRTAALNEDNLGLDLQIKNIAVGSGQYNAATAAPTKTALTTELERYLVNGGEIEPTTHTLRFTVNLNSTITADIYEIGLFDENNVLFAVASSTTSPLVQLINEVITIITFGFSLDDVDNITLMLDVNSPLAVTLMNQHTAHEHPHAQYKRINDDTERLKVANGTDPKDAVNKEQLDAEATARANADTNLQNTKAAKNGDNTQRFKVSNAVDADDAVAKNQLDTLAQSVSTKANKNGDAAETFNVVNGTSGSHAVNKSQLDAVAAANLTNIAVINLIYPVGIVVDFSVNTNPNAIWSGTIWNRFAEGKTTVGYQSGDADFGTIGQTGGKKGHKMTLDNLIEHEHKQHDNTVFINNLGLPFSHTYDGSSYDHYYASESPNNAKTDKTGSADPVPIPTLPPYVVTAKWVRTA